MTMREKARRPRVDVGTNSGRRRAFEAATELVCGSLINCSVMLTDDLSAGRFAQTAISLRINKAFHSNLSNARANDHVFRFDFLRPISRVRRM